MAHQKRILIIEDDTFLRDLYEEMLSDAGYDVEVAEEGSTGFQKIKSQKFDLVLLDIMLPEKDGLQILHDLDGEKKKIPIVMLTNLGQDQVIKEALTAGASGYFIKSDLDPDEVLSKVEEFLE